MQNATTTTPAVHYDNPWLEAAAEAGSEFRNIVKFNKGDWLRGDDCIPESSEFVAYIDQLLRGWIRFKDGAVVDRYIVPISAGRPPEREELGDLDPSEWKETDADGRPRDPFVKQWMLPLMAVDTEDFAVFATGSKGGIAAIGDLCRVYGRAHRNGLLPIVALKTRSYKHPIYGKIQTPDLPIVGWHETAPEAAGPNTTNPSPGAGGASAPSKDPMDEIDRFIFEDATVGDSLCLAMNFDPNQCRHAYNT
jgi:hypothetical protein